MEYENANRVFLLNRDGKPLMPVLSKKGQAASEKRQGFCGQEISVALLWSVHEND
ncbi:hypothetical protein ACXO8O_08335 [Lactobacillus delbrueckii subsp. bulgaricus]